MYCRKHQGCDTPVKQPSPSHEGDLDCANLGGFTNRENSCYFDSFLYAFLHKRNAYIDYNFLNRDVTADPQLKPTVDTIQYLLRQAQDLIHQRSTTELCMQLRKNLQKYDKIYTKMGKQIEHLRWVREGKHTAEQLSPIDVMTRLNQIFEPREETLIEQTLWRGPDIDHIKQTSSEIRPTSFVVEVQQNSISEFNGEEFVDLPDEYDLQELVNEIDVIDSDEGVVAKSQVVVSSPILYIPVHRIAGGGDQQAVKIQTTIIPPNRWNLQDNTHLKLVSVIVHQGDATGGHYIAYINCGNQWYLYNDIGFKKLQLIGSYKDLIQTDVPQNATDFVYI
jgi:hypothetical protein